MLEPQGGGWPVPHPEELTDQNLTLRGRHGLIRANGGARVYHRIGGLEDFRY